MLAIIGGSGFEKFEGFKTIKELPRETPWGLASSGLRTVQIDGTEALFVSRHGQHHELLPSEVNYRANIFLLKKYGAKAIVSFSAVGSLRKELKPGDLVIPSQYIDRTKGVRAHTFLGDGIVGHVSLAKPVCGLMTEHAKSISKNRGFDIHFDKTHVVIEGPYFSTVAESHAYRQMNADIIGMTNFPEFALAREAGLPYLPNCFVTDYDCWDQSIPHAELPEILKVMRENNAKGFGLLQDYMKLGSALYADSPCYNQGLKTGLMTPESAIPDKQKKWLPVLISN